MEYSMFSFILCEHLFTYEKCSLKYSIFLAGQKFWGTQICPIKLKEVRKLPCAGIWVGAGNPPLVVRLILPAPLLYGPSRKRAQMIAGLGNGSERFSVLCGSQGLKAFMCRETQMPQRYWAGRKWRYQNVLWLFYCCLTIILGLRHLRSRKKIPPRCFAWRLLKNF